MEQLTKNNMNFSTSAILFLPFIHQPASNIDTIYTTLQCAINNTKKDNQNTCLVTFDIKAREE